MKAYLVALICVKIGEVGALHFLRDYKNSLICVKLGEVGALRFLRD
jgi:hypothetical protein